MIVVASYPKSGLHLARSLLRGSGYETTHTHAGPASPDARAKAPDLHVVRDVRDVVVSAVCHFVLERPELDPAAIRPHVIDMAARLRGPWQHAPGAASWSDYVLAMTERARLTVDYADLVERPREALTPLGVEVAPVLDVDTETDRQTAWETSRFRRGVPGGWRDVLTSEQAEQIAEWHAPGLWLLEQLRAGAAT